jgi:NAD(P)-dependent dehydrogenase (short-subunit alcohol dehydrogenase family)
MSDIVITGASRGIGRALALALAGRADRRLVLVARDEARLSALAAEVEAKGTRATVVAGDLGDRAGARALGARLAEAIGEGATLVHDAGLWPTKRALVEGGLEAAFVVNHLGPTLMQAPMLEAKRLARVMVVSAGLAAFGKPDAERTPIGADFSRFRTYCTTKLCFAIAMREVAEAHPEVDVVVLHPGVVRTDLGAHPGLFGKIVDLMKRRMEAPEVCGARLARILDRPRWSPPGEARWMFEEQEKPWFAAAGDEGAKRAVRAMTARFGEARS